MKKQLDLQEIKKFFPYENRWVALDKTRKNILVAGATIKEVENRLKKSKKKASEIRYVLPFNQYYCPYGY